MSTHTLNGNQGTATKAELNKSHVFKLLSVARRRYVVRLLYENETLTERELIDKTCELEFDKPISRISSKERKRVHVGLYQVHIPKLEDANIICKENGLYTLDTNASQLLEHMDVERSWFNRFL